MNNKNTRNKIFDSYSYATFFSWQFTLLVIAMIPLYYWVLNHFNKRLLDASKKERKEYSKVMESLREKIEGINIIETR